MQNNGLQTGDFVQILRGQGVTFGTVKDHLEDDRILVSNILEYKDKQRNFICESPYKPEQLSKLSGKSDMPLIEFYCENIGKSPRTVSPSENLVQRKSGLIAHTKVPAIVAS